jgi:hypothetical protein
LRKQHSCRNPSIWLAIKARVLRGCGPRSRPGTHITCSRECKESKECEGMNPHTPKWTPTLGVGESWSPKGTPKTSERDLRGQISMACGALYINEKLLKRRCLKWARIAHLDIWNTSYGQKKAHIGPKEGCRQRAIYRWKALDESYNFASDRIAIGALHKKLCALKVPGVPVGGISGVPRGSPAGVPGEKSHLDVGPVERHKVYYKGEGGDFPKSGPWWIKWVQGCPWLFLAPKVLQLCTNHFVRVLCKLVWVSEACQLLLVPSRSSNPPLYPSKGCELGSVPRLLLFPLPFTWTHIWVLPGVGSASIPNNFHIPTKTKNISNIRIHHYSCKC